MDSCNFNNSYSSISYCNLLSKYYTAWWGALVRWLWDNPVRVAFFFSVHAPTATSSRSTRIMPPACSTKPHRHNHGGKYLNSYCNKAIASNDIRINHPCCWLKMDGKTGRTIDLMRCGAVRWHKTNWSSVKQTILFIFLMWPLLLYLVAVCCGHVEYIYRIVLFPLSYCQQRYNTVPWLDSQSGVYVLHWVCYGDAWNKMPASLLFLLSFFSSANLFFFFGCSCFCFCLCVTGTFSELSLPFWTKWNSVLRLSSSTRLARCVRVRTAKIIVLRNMNY